MRNGDAPALAIGSKEAILAMVVATAAAGRAATQTQFDPLQQQVFGNAGDPSVAVDFGDVDGDGDLDVVFVTRTLERTATGSTARSIAQLFLNDGRGRFTERPDAFPSALPRFRSTVTLADIDGDGDLDAFVANAGGTNPEPDQLYLNDGSGSFTEAPSLLPPNQEATTSVVPGDIDGDGDIDFAVSTASTSAAQLLQIYTNDGTGRLELHSTPVAPAPGEANLVTGRPDLGDVDGDGDLDILLPVASDFPFPFRAEIPSRNRLLIQIGEGEFVESAVLPAPGPTVAAKFGDVDGDGDLDVLLANYGSANSLWLNDGAGHFVDASVRCLPPTEQESGRVELGDLDGDGDLDAVFACSGASAETAGGRATQILRNDGSGKFTEAGPTAVEINWSAVRDLSLDDVDGDGDLDLTTVNDSPMNSRRLYRNDGQGRFTEALRSRVTDPRTILSAAGDLDGDGDEDLVVISDFNLRVQLQDRSGRFRDLPPDAVPGLPFGVGASALQLGDVDGDGDLDLVVGLVTGPRNDEFGFADRLFLNDGTAGFREASSARFPTGRWITSGLELQDLDGDGDLDVIASSRAREDNSGPIFAWVPEPDQILINDGQGWFTNESIARWPGATRRTNAMAVGDLDSDGDLDVMYGEVAVYPSQPGMQTLGIELNNGQGVLTNQSPPAVPSPVVAPYDIDLGDLDGDGDLDAFCLFGGSEPLVLINDGAAGFTDVSNRFPDQSGTLRSAELADFDGDGAIDIVASVRFEPLCLFRNLGDGSFVDASAARMGTQGVETQSVIAHDLDGDHDIDLILNGYGGGISFNLLRHVDTPAEPRVGETFSIDVYARYGPARVFDVAVPLVSTSPASISVHPLGTFGVDPSQAITLPAIQIPQPAGVATLDMQLPTDPTLRGIELFTQAALVQWPRTPVLTNVAFSVIR